MPRYWGSPCRVADAHPGGVQFLCPAGQFIPHRAGHIPGQQLLQAAEIHTATAEIGRREFRHGEQRRPEAEDRRPAAEQFAATGALPQHCQREGPEEQRIGPEEGFQGTGNHRSSTPAGVEFPLQRRRAAHNDQRQGVVQRLGGTAEHQAQRHPQADQREGTDHLLPDLQPGRAHKESDAHYGEKNIAPEHRVDTGAEQKARQGVRPDQEGAPGTVPADVAWVSS